MQKDGKELKKNVEVQGEESYLKKFGIKALNPMQKKASKTIQAGSDMVLLSPTGTGKTFAFLLPIVEALEIDIEEIQVLILVPSRELAQQIEQVIRKMGSGYKVNAVYGGRAGTLDKILLKHRPAILVGTPGRIADRLRRDNYTLEHIKTLVLDEFDKSLETGFEIEMSEIIETLPKVEQRILTSATNDPHIPDFVGLHKPVYVNYLKEGVAQLAIKTILSPVKDKLDTLGKALDKIGDQPGIIFCNYKDGLARVSEFMKEHEIDHECFHGSMEQVDRERALVKFRNGTIRYLLATDLAARGLDIPEIKFIIHYHTPLSKKEFTHRNGRTARMNKEGVAYVLHWDVEPQADYIEELGLESIPIDELEKSEVEKVVKWQTLYISGGRKDKISKGDIAGLFYKQGELEKDQLGVIEVKQNGSYVSVQADIAEAVIEKTNNTKLKKKKVRISLI